MSIDTTLNWPEACAIVGCAWACAWFLKGYFQ